MCLRRLGLVAVVLPGLARAAEDRALVSREQALALGNRVVIDHGGEVDARGRRWVQVLADPMILDGLPPDTVRARQPVVPGPPPAGLSLPEGEGRARFEAAVAAAPRSGWVSLGFSAQGREMVAAWFGQPPEEGAPALWVMGGHHGDEVAGYEVALWLSEALGAGDHALRHVQQALDERTVWVVPWVNPDGVTEGIRYNSHMVDLNRNYGFQWRSNELRSGSEAFSEPETVTMRQLGEWVRPFAGLSLHSGAVNIGYVWNYTEDPAPDHDALLALAEAYGALCTTSGFYVTNGAAWYITHGDSNDWAYGRYGTWEFTVELSRTKRLEVDQLQPVLDEHAASVLEFVLQPIREVAVVDAETGAPLEAWVQVGDGQPRWTVASSGRVGVGAWEGEAVTVGAWGYGTGSWDGTGKVALQPEQRIFEAASPPWIPSAPRAVVLPGRGPSRVLRKVGEDPVTVTVDAQGRGRVPAKGMRAGWWTVQDGEGTIFPRALAVGAVSVSPPVWPAVEQGARAFVLGEERQLVEVSVEAAGWPLPPQPVLVVDADGERLLVPETDEGESVAIRGGGCALVPQTGHLALLLVSMAAVRRRRTPRSRA